MEKFTCAVWEQYFAANGYCTRGNNLSSWSNESVSRESALLLSLVYQQETKLFSRLENTFNGFLFQTICVHSQVYILSQSTILLLIEVRVFLSSLIWILNGLLVVYRFIAPHARNSPKNCFFFAKYTLNIGFLAFPRIREEVASHRHIFANCTKNPNQRWTPVAWRSTIFLLTFSCSSCLDWPNARKIKMSFSAARKTQQTVASDAFSCSSWLI